MKPPDCTIRFLTRSRVFFELSFLSLCLNRLSLLFCDFFNGTFPFKTLSAHSQRQHNRVFLQFFIIFFLILGEASLSSFSSAKFFISLVDIFLGECQFEGLRELIFICACIRNASRQGIYWFSIYISRPNPLSDRQEDSR